MFQAVENGVVNFVCPLYFFHAENHQSDRKQFCKFIDDIKRCKVDEVPKTTETHVS